MTLQKKKLTDFVKHAKKLTGKNALSVLNDIVISVEKDELHLECTDLRYFFKAELPFEEYSFGEKLTFPKTLFTNYTIFEALKACKGPVIEVTVNHHDNLCFNDIVLPVSEIDYSKYPENPFGNNKLTSSGTISRMDTFERAFKFISDDETRYFMNGVHFVLTDGKLHFESTDGRTGLQSDPIMGKSEPGINVDYIVNDIAKFIPLNMNHFKTTDKMIEYSNEMYRLAVTHIDGQFPNISRVIPDLKYYDKLPLDRTAFQAALKKLTLELKMKGTFKPAKTRIHIMLGGISTDEDTSAKCIALCKTGIPVDIEVCIALKYLNPMINRDHGFEFYIADQSPHNRAVCIVDKVFNTIEVTMPMQRD